MVRLYNAFWYGKYCSMAALYGFLSSEKAPFKLQNMAFRIVICALLCCSMRLFGLFINSVDIVDKFYNSLRLMPL